MATEKNPDAEIWRYIPDFEDYAVSSRGRVFNVDRYRELYGRRGTDGRRKIRLFSQGDWIDKYVHQCMAMAFVVGHEWGDPVGHWNGVYWDNRLENLRLYVYNFGYILEPQWFPIGDDDGY